MRSIPPGETSVLQNDLLHVSKAPLYRRTFAFTQPERLTQRKSKRPIEGLAYIVLFVDFIVLLRPWDSTW